MALVSCPECRHQVSDAASSCPSCGHPINPAEQTAATSSAASQSPAAEKTQLFKAGGDNFVLNEIAALSSIKTRDWALLTIAVPVFAAIVYAWLNMAWPFAAGITVACLLLLAFLVVDEGVIASTGNVTPVSENMTQVAERYHSALSSDELIVYKGRNTFVDMSFTVNPRRVSQFSKKYSLRDFIFYILGIAAIAAGYQMNAPLFYIIGAVVLVLGFLMRKSTLEVVGVGGAKMKLYTKASDINRVVTELTQSIGNVSKS